MSIYVPGSAGSPTLADLVADVNERLDNRIEYGFISRTSDGITTRYFVNDRFVRQLGSSDPGRLRVYVVDTDGVQTELTSGWSFDYGSGWLVLDEPPESGYVLRVEYSFQRWRDSLTTRIINNGLGYLFPDFYAIGDDTLDVSSTGRYELVASNDQPIAGIIEVEIATGETTYRLTPFRDYRVIRGVREACELHIFASTTGFTETRVTYAYRPSELEDDEDSLLDKGLPDHMREALVLYTCWQLLSQQLAPRMRYDQAVVTQGAGTPTVRDQQSTAQIYKMMLDIEVNKRKMRPWVIRGI